VLSELVRAAKAEGWNVNFIEAVDQAWKLPLDGSWGLFEDGTSEPKFRWGEPVSNYPHWRTEAALGIGAAFYVYLAAWFGGLAGNRSALSWKRSLAVATIALVSGLVFGWGALQLPIVSPLLGDKIRAVVLFVLALIVPGIAAAAMARGLSLRGLSLALNPQSWRRADMMSVLLASMLAASIAIAIHFALSLVFESRGNTYPLAGLTAIVAALAATVVARPLAMLRPGVAEIVAALMLCSSAIYIAVTEGIANWQALWFAALLVALSLTALLARAAPD
jgi:glucan 1,3-beta-glucosidase